MNKVYLLIGGNLGNRKDNLELATMLIGKQAGTVYKASSLYETAAWGKTDQPAFLNQALFIQTPLDPLPLLQRLLTIELNMGRKRMEKNGPRIIDIDIILFNNAIIDEPELKIPHPAMQQRRFVLSPMAELAPWLKHPVLQQSMQQLLDQCTDPLPVKKLP